MAKAEKAETCIVFAEETGASIPVNVPFKPLTEGLESRLSGAIKPVDKRDGWFTTPTSLQCVKADRIEIGTVPANMLAGGWKEAPQAKKPAAKKPAKETTEGEK